MKILHCSDIHLGKKPFGSKEYSEKRYDDYFYAFDHIVETAIKENVKVFMIAGDFFDKKELLPQTLDKAESSLKKLRSHDIKTYIIEGNHDSSKLGKEYNSWINYLENKDYFKKLKYEVKSINEEEKYFFDKEIVDDVNFYGLGYPGHNIRKVLENLENELDANEKNIVLVHTAIASGDFLAGTVEKETIDRFKDKVIYIAGGHFHSYYTYPKDTPYFFLPGSSEFWNIQNEKTQKKGFIIFDSANVLEYKHYESKTRKRIILQMDIESEDPNDFKDEFTSKIEDIEINKGEDIIVIDMKIINNIFVNTNFCEEILQEKGALKTFIKTRYTKDNRIKNVKNLSKEEIEVELIKKWEVFGNKSERVVEILDKLKYDQRNSNKELFVENFDHMIKMFLDGDNNEN